MKLDRNDDYLSYGYNSNVNWHCYFFAQNKEIQQLVKLQYVIMGMMSEMMW